MRDGLPTIRARGAELVVIGSGEPHQAREFRDELGIDFPLLADPELRAFAAAGLHRGLRATLAARALGHAVRALRDGFRQGRLRGDAWQQGGVFVIAAGGQVLFEQRSETAGDHADPRLFLEALPPSTPGSER